MSRAPYRRIAAPRDDPSPSRDPLSSISTLVVAGSAVGGVLSLGLLIMIWTGLPVVRPFLVAAAVLGCVLGLAMWFSRR